MNRFTPISQISGDRLRSRRSMPDQKGIHDLQTLPNPVGPGFSILDAVTKVIKKGSEFLDFKGDFT